MKKTLSLIISVFSVVVFIFSIYIIIGSTIAIRNNEIFRIFGYSYAVVPTNSMAGDNPDSFDAGDAVIIYNTPYSQLEIGDVIVYESIEDGRLIIHRIIDVLPDGFVTKGDNNQIADTQIITELAYKGKYHSHFSFFGIGLWLTDFRVILLGSLMAILFIAVVYQVIKLIWDYKKQKLEQYQETLKKELEQNDNEG